MKIVIKRNGVPVRFDGEKIENAIMKAMIDAHHVDKSVCRLIANNIKEIDKKEITIYEIEDEIYNQLIELNHSDTARYYVEFKAVRTSIRNYKNNVFDQMQDVMDQKSEDIRDNANKSGDKLGTLRAMFSDICCKEFVKERITSKHLAEEQEKLIYEHDRNYRNIPFTNCELVNYRDMMKNGFHVGQTYIHDIKGITTAVALLSQIIAHVTSSTYGLK